MSTQSMQQICFFPDDKQHRFQPLILTRPFDDLRIGIFTIRQKWMRTLDVNSFGRLQGEFLNGVFSRGSLDESSSILWINPRFLPSDNLMPIIQNLKIGEQVIFKGDVVAALVDGNISKKMFESNQFYVDGLKEINAKDLIHLENLWDLLSLNSYEIEKDILLTGLKTAHDLEIKPEGNIHHPKNTYIGKGVVIEPGVNIIAEDGPVILMDNVLIEAGSILRGPVAIGKGAIVKMSTRIHSGSTIGPVCKVGGEVSNCIFHSYSNKAHDGYAGNSIFGQWVNLGAGTNTSNLKNNYSPIRIKDWKSKKEVDTEQQFLGTIMADQSKTSINTMLNTGTICGVSSNIFMSGFPPEYIPSFSWVVSEDYGVYKFEKAIEAMRAMMKRRDVEMNAAYEKMMEYHFKNR